MEKGRAGGKERENRSTLENEHKIGNEMIFLALETGAATDLQQSSSTAAAAATELKLKRT